MRQRWKDWKAKYWGLSLRTDLQDLSFWEEGGRLDYPRWRRALRSARAWGTAHPYAASMWLITLLGTLASVIAALR